jgi:adenylate cyclase
VDFMDSSGLGILIGALKHARSGGGDIRIGATNPTIRKMFELTGLMRTFEFERSVDPWEYLLEGGWQDEPALVLGALKLALLGGQDDFDESELSSAAGVELATVRQLWRAMGFADPEPGTRGYTQADLNALSRAGAALSARGEATVVQHTQVLSSLLARAADVVATSLLGDIEGYRQAGLAGADAAAAAVVQLQMLEVSDLLDYLFRRQLVTVLTRQLTADSEFGHSSGRPTAVMFADLVDFTPLSQQMEDADLARFVTRFQSVAFDLVAAAGGRIVKTLGDEVMVVCDDISAAAGIATALAQAYLDDELLPAVRIGMAYGPVLRVQGDYFGPTVNLASRLVGMADPGSVVISEETHRALSAESDLAATKLAPRRLKGIGWTATYALAGAE